MKHLGIILSKHVSGPYEDNYKILIKDIKEQLNKW